jgi:hypothetical protein
MEQSFGRANTRSRDRLVALIKDLDDGALQQNVNEEWTIAATLAHVAFWDRMCLARWDAYDAGGSLEDVPGKIIDLVNAANLPAWRALPGRTAVDLLSQAMDDLDHRIALLPEASQRAAAAGGFLYMLDRTRHRDEHATEIEAILTRQ